jgi:phage gp46-like protein
MSGFNFRIDPDTKDYVLTASGSFELDPTAQTPMVLQLLDARGQWWAELRLGSNVARVFRGAQPDNPAQALRAVIVEALQVFVRSGRLRTFSVTVDEDTVPLVATVTAVDGDSQAIQLTVVPVG